MSVPADEPLLIEPPPGSPEATNPKDVGSITRLLAEAAEHEASDLLLIAGAPPTMFAGGRWMNLGDQVLTVEEVVSLVVPILNSDRQERLRRVRDLDLGFSLPGLGRLRMNLHYQRGGLAAAIRMIPEEVPAFDSLNLPAQVLRLAYFSSGLVLVTGGTGQGKSTTLAAIINHMNRHSARHIITIEDPVEFAFKHGKCIIEQREVGDDSPTFTDALRHVLRQRPDVILIGEIRDTETMATALTAAETGHLVLTTLHTASAAQTITRMIDVFSSTQQPQVRTQLAGSLKAILCQSLVHDGLNNGLVPATEFLMATPAVRRAIRDNETHLIYSMIETGRRHGMHTLEQSLESLVKSGRVAAEESLAAAADPVRMQKMVGHHLDAAGASARHPNADPA